ncbi:hypothetical protein QE394_001101 [Arthrobacter sp. SORGH_AS 212]|uniref:minor capsid protein n=1 Tax=Pseudarthrobacter sp. SORGH_AS 212 TaxID=3041777 RepID=UPI0027846CE3|nr:hypothetical protein [Arthrobacter sp. SORGH_AS_0212]
MAIVFASLGFEYKLLIGLGEYLGSQSVGRWITSGTYLATDTAITVDALPATPDKAIAMTLYGVEDAGAGTDSVQGVQFRIRGKAGDRLSDKDISSRLFDALHGRTNFELNGIPIVRAWRQSATPLGPDGNNRQEHSHNYYLQLTRTGTYRED